MRTFFLCTIAGLLVLGAQSDARGGAAKGALKRINTVQGFHVMTYRVTFTAGLPAVVEVQGDGDTDLGLTVLDAQGKRIAAARPGDRPSVRWTPTSNEPYSIKIANRGGVPNRFLLKSN